METSHEELTVRRLMIMRGIAALVALGTAIVQGQSTIPCPTKTGVYASTHDAWTEIPREADPLTTIKPNFLNPTLPKTSKVFAGERAFVTLGNPLQFCVVGASAGASFSLEKAVAKKGTRTIVRVGDYQKNKASQAQAMASVTDERGNIHLMTTALEQGQYILVMLGAFNPTPKPPSSNSQADATAAIVESTTAMAQSIANGTKGINFGLGIE